MKKTLFYSFFQLKMFIKLWRLGIILFIAPMLVLSGIGFICIQLISKDGLVEPFQVAIVDNDRTKATEFIIQHLKENEQIAKVITFTELNEKSANQMMEKNKITAIIFIPNGFSHDVSIGINTPVTVISNVKKPIQSLLTVQLLESATKFTSAAQSGINTIYHFLEKANVDEERINEEYNKSLATFALHILGRGEIFQVTKKTSINHHLLEYYSNSFYVLTMMLWSFIVYLLLKFNISTSLKLRLMTRGLTAKANTMASLITSFIVITILSTFCVILLSLIFDIHWFQLTVQSFLVVLSFALLFSLISSICSSNKIFMTVGFCIIIIGIIGGGHIIPVIYYPIWLEQVGKMTINYWALSLISGKGNALSLIVFNICTLLMLIILLFFQKKDSRVGGID